MAAFFSRLRLRVGEGYDRNGLCPPWVQPVRKLGMVSAAHLVLGVGLAAQLSG